MEIRCSHFRLYLPIYRADADSRCDRMFISNRTIKKISGLFGYRDTIGIPECSIHEFVSLLPRRFGFLNSDIWDSSFTTRVNASTVFRLASLVRSTQNVLFTLYTVFQLRWETLGRCEEYPSRGPKTSILKTEGGYRDLKHIGADFPLFQVEHIASYHV